VYEPKYEAPKYEAPKYPTYKSKVPNYHVKQYEEPHYEEPYYPEYEQKYPSRRSSYDDWYNMPNGGYAEYDKTYHNDYDYQTSYAPTYDSYSDDYEVSYKPQKYDDYEYPTLAEPYYPEPKKSPARTTSYDDWYNMPDGGHTQYEHKSMGYKGVMEPAYKERSYKKQHGPHGAELVYY